MIRAHLTAGQARVLSSPPAMEGPRLTAVHLLLLAALVAVGGWVRFHDLERSGFLSTDEGLHFYEAHRMAAVSDALRALSRICRTSRQTDTEPRYRLTEPEKAEVLALAAPGVELQYGRPLHDVLLWASARQNGWQ